MGRLVSLVIGLAAVNGSSVRFTQIFRAPLWGLRNPMYFPSGEIWAPVISGSPKNSSRSRTGGCCAYDTTVRTHSTEKSANAENRITVLPLQSILALIGTPVNRTV